MKLNNEGIKNKNFWENAGVLLPRYNIRETVEKTKQNPVWLHFGAGNIFRAFLAVLQQNLLNRNETDRGIIAAETFDYEIIDKIYAPSDNLILNVILNSDSTMSREIVASVAEAVKADFSIPDSLKRLTEIACSPSLQIMSFTVTEKGYAIINSTGEPLPAVSLDIKNGPEKARHVMSITAALLYKRYKAGMFPISVVSLDNCSHNGEKLSDAVVQIARGWLENGFADTGFINWLTDEKCVSFPWSMIDKITPRPAKIVADKLKEYGIEGMETLITEKDTHIALYANAEKPQYLVIEDNFPNSRPPLENAGVYFTDRETVNKVERMKVTTCLNPLHTALSVFGCLLGYKHVHEVMKDDDIEKLIKRLGYTEGLSVVTDPVILSPKAFIDEVVNERLPNPFMPDELLRITTDTSQKVSVRFGETIKSYIKEGKNLAQLIAIPLSVAGWLRYLLAADDRGKPIAVSTDPLKDELQAKLKDIVWNNPQSVSGQLSEILSNSVIFGLDITQTSLGDTIEKMFTEMLSGEGAVRNTLRKYLK
ncbi:MAG: mannitol dehydrogenase family protein [Clostridiales bacterium]|nr:mannitol dehydrogenase family protein [Clostridiales bacterium]